MRKAPKSKALGRVRIIHSCLKKEINIAVSDGKTIIPVKLEDITLNSSMRFYLNDQQIVSVKELNEQSAEMQKVLTAVRAYTGTTHTKPKSTEKEDASLVDPWECYRRGYCFELGEGTPVDYEQAGYWYEMGASQGNAWCQHRMGEFFLLGRGRAQDFSEAVKWYMRGAVQKDHSSCERLAQCYENGWGIKRDLHLANVWRKRAIQYKK